PAFISLRLKFVDALAMKVKAGLSKEDRVFVSKLLLAGAQNQKLPWIYTWIHDAKMNREKFRDLVEYPILTNPIFVSEVKGLKAAYEDNFSCTIKSSAENNDLVAFDYKTHVYDHLSSLKNKEPKVFFDFAAAGMTGLKMSIEVCRELETNKYGVNFPKLVASFVNFLGEKKFYEFAKFLLRNTTVKGDTEKTFAENLYMADFIASEIFSTSTVLNEKIIKRTREFYPVIYDVIQKLPPEAYLNLGEALQDLLKEESDDKFQGVVSFWNFFNDTEKNFVFNFVDRHFDGDTQYVLLFDFYTKFLDDLHDVQPVFKEAWVGSKEREEQSYLAMQDLFYQLDGKDTLLDFQKFFGRDQILRVLEVISNGSNINANAKAELAHIRSNEYLARSRSENYVFQVYDPGSDTDYNARPVIECMQKFAEIENGFYQLVRKLPEACSKISNENVAFRVFGWLNSIENSYKEFKPGVNSDETILSSKGLLSPHMLNNAIGTTKILDSLLGDINSALPTKNGINYLLSSAKYHLNEKEAAPLVDKNLAWLKKWFDTSPVENLIYRNAVIKKFSGVDNFARANIVSKNFAELSSMYADWVKAGKLDIAQRRSLGTYDPNSACDKVINKVVTEYPCPSVDIIKQNTDDILKYLTVVWEKDQGTAIAQILKAVKPGEGLDIPLNGKKTKKYRLTLKETMKYLYDSSDKTREINRKKAYFVNKDGNGSNQILTTLERIEIVIREVRFDNNYLGTAFLNSITQAEDYTEEAKSRKGLLEKCIKIPGIRCARPMSDDDLRMAKNALETFDSLIEINTEFKYGNFLKTFEQSLVGSSAKKAQEVQLLPLKNEYLLQHNGRLLGNMTGMTMWSNTARVIRDRVGRTQKDFNTFIEGDSLNRVNNALLYGFDLPQATPSAERLLKKVLAVPNGEKQNISSTAIDWLASLSYDQVRLVEDTVGRLLLVSSYLGTPDVVFGTAPNAKFDIYKNNNLLQIFLALEKVIDHYPTFKNFLPADVKFIDIFKPMNNALVFLNEALESTNNPEKNTAYIAINDAFNIAQTLLFDEMADPRFATLNEQKVKGIDLLMSFASNPKNVYETYVLIRDDYHYLDVLHLDNASWFKAFGLNVNRIADAKRVDFTPLRDYLGFTTKSAICLNRDSECVPNYHFDELTNLLKYLTTKNSDGQTYFSLATKKVLVENFDQLNVMIEDLLPALKIKEVKPPLTIN
ncbi:MAG: hypothetical protein K2Q18_01070, partial [Bdellovibrionales bacterium]|nr:hypothetical protein [Bdellovibrionales bacterium]